jgi:hypothetical protein
MSPLWRRSLSLNAAIEPAANRRDFPWIFSPNNVDT